MEPCEAIFHLFSVSVLVKQNQNESLGFDETFETKISVLVSFFKVLVTKF